MNFLTGSVIAGSIVVVFVLALLGGAGLSGQGPTLRDRILSSPTLSPLLIIHYFLPYSLVVLVLFMDIMSQLPQGVWSILVGGAVFIANYMFGHDSSVLPNDLCEIPGLKGMSSSLMPQSLLFVSIVVSYLAMFVTTSSNALSSSSISSMSPSPSGRIGASWGLAGAVILIQLIGILTTPSCLSSVTVRGIELPSSVRAILTAIVGIAIGTGAGAGFAGLSITQPSYSATASAGSSNLSSGTTSPTKPSGPGFVRERFQLGSGLGEMPTASGATQGDLPVDIAKTTGAVTPGESSDQFVCEAYKNGQLVTSTLIE